MSYKSYRPPLSEITVGPTYYENGKPTFDWVWKYWHERPRVELQLKWYDLWIGAYYDQPNRTWYICPLPCVVIKVYPKVLR